MMQNKSAITKGYADTCFGQIHYLSTTRRDLPVLVLLHQTPSSAEMFRPLMQALANDFYCIAPDFIGFGNSDAIDKSVEHSIKLYSDSVYACLDKLQINQCIVFGHHTGASVAAQLAFDHTDLCSQLVLSGPPLLPDELKLALPNTVVDSTVDEHGQFLDRYWQKIRAKDATVPLSLSLRETLFALALGENYKKAYEAVASHDFEKIIGSISCPTLVFAGDRDVLQPFVEQTVALLRQGEKATIGDSSTYVCETHYLAVADLIRQFYNKFADS